MEETLNDTVEQEQPPKKLSVKEFAAKVKAKYPDYNSVADDVLVQKIIDKYPDYKDQVDLTQKKNLSENISTPSTNGVSKPSDGIDVKAEAAKFEKERAQERYANNFGLADPRQLQLAQTAQADNTTSKAVEQTGMSNYEKIEHEERAAKKQAYKEKIEKATPIAIDNTAKKALQQKGLNPNNKALLNKEKERLSFEYAKGDATVGFDKDGTPGLFSSSGFFENFHKSMMGAIQGNKEAREFHRMSIPEKAEFAKKKMSEQEASTEYLGDKPTPLGTVGEAGGGMLPSLGLYGAGMLAGSTIQAAAPATGGLSELALPSVMAFTFNAAGGADHSEYAHTMQNFAEIKRNNPEMDDVAAMTLASKDKDINRAAGIVETALFSRTGGAALKVGKSATGRLLKGMAKEAVKGGSIVGGVEGARSLAQGETVDESIKNAVEAFEEAAPTFGALHGVMATIGGIWKAPNLIKSALKYDAVTKHSPEEISAVIENGVRTGEIPQELADKTKQELHEFRNALNKTDDSLSDDAKASVAGLEILAEKKKMQSEGKGQAAKDIALQEIESINNQIKEIYRTGKPLEHEINEATGETYKQPTFDDVQKERIEIAADKISKGKRLDEPEYIQAEQQFPDELKKELEKIKKSETPKEDETQSDVYKNVNKYLKQNEQATEAQTQEAATPKKSETQTSEEKIVEPLIVEPSVENKNVELTDENKILLDGKEIGNIESLYSVGDNEYQMSGIEITDKSLRGKGYGKQVYKLLIDRLGKEGKTLYADDTALSKDAKRVWESLVKSGEAEKTNTGYVSPKKAKAEEKLIVEPSVENKPNEEYRDDIMNMLTDMKESGFEHRISSEISQKEREKGVTDLREGKDTAAAKKVKALIDGIVENGVMPMTRGRGNNVEKRNITFDEWFGTAEDKEAVNKVAEHLDDNAVGIINSEGIKQENLSNFNHLFNDEGFPYSKSDFQQVESYLARQAEGSAKTPQLSDKSESVSQIPNKKLAEEKPTVGNEVVENKEAEIGENKNSEPPKPPPVEDVAIGNAHLEYPPTSLSYQGTGKIETEFGVDERLPTKTKHDIETIKQADNLLEEGWNVKDALNKIDEGHMLSDAEYINMTRYAAELSERLRSMDVNAKDYDATLSELNRVANASNTAGKEQGRALGIRGRFKTVQDGTYADFMLTELNANNDAPLTENQKATAQKDFTELDAAKTKFEADKKIFEDKVAAFKAEQELTKQKKTASKGKRRNHDDLVKERQEIFTSISDKLKKARSETSATFVPYANELIAIAPDVLKLARNLVEDGVVKLEEVIKNIHPQLKGDIPDLKERDIHDIIAGEYTKKKQTKNEVAKAMEDLRIEAGLINRLEKLQKDIPKEEKLKIKRNQEIEKVRNQIKDYKKEEAEANKFFGESDAGNRAAERKQDVAEEKEANKFYGEEKNPQRAALVSLKRKNIKETEKIREKLRTFDYEPDVKKKPILDDKELQRKFPHQFKDALKSRDDLIAAKRKIALRRLQQMYDNKTPEEKAIEVFSKTLNVPRTLMASMDVSAPLRQAIIATTAHPQLASKALKFMFEAAANERVYNRWLDDVHNSPRWDVAEKINLAITDPESLHVRQAEEAFQGAPYAEKVPIVGAGVKASERAYIGYLNKLRWDLFNMYADRFEAQGKTFDNNPKLYEGLSSFINSATGRGNMKGLESAAPIFNWVLFASKLIASRVNMLGLSDLPNLVVRGATLGKYGLDYGFYSKLPPKIRIEAAKDILKFIAIGTSTLLVAKGLSNATGGDIEVENDPRSSDFGKIKSGNTRWDIWGGFQPYARVLTQFISAERKAATSGKIYELDGKGFMGENRLSPLATFARGKLAPVPSAAINLFSGRDVIGQPVTVADQVINNITPLLFNDVYKAMQDQGVRALYTVGIPSAFGVGVQTYDNSNKGGKGGGGGASSSHKIPTPEDAVKKQEAAKRKALHLSK